MRLSSHTDFGLRLLMLSAKASPESITIGRVSAQLKVSHHHLMKVAQSLSRAGLLETVRGRSGGFKLARQPNAIRLGEAVRTLESQVGLVECMRSEQSQCPLIPECRLPRMFHLATDAFFEVLDGWTLDDLIAGDRPLLQLSEAK